MVNTQSELMLKAQALMKQKDELEAEIRSQQDDLQSVHATLKLASPPYAQEPFLSYLPVIVVVLRQILPEPEFCSAATHIILSSILS
jgi:hypothetical protein